MIDENIVYWSPDCELKLSDFKKEFDEKDRHTFSYIGYDPSFEIKYNEDKTKFVIDNISLKTIFWRDKSFFNHIMAKNYSVPPRDIDYLILHEQVHFDLSEELRPKIEREITSQCKGKIFQQEVQI